VITVKLNINGATKYVPHKPMTYEEIVDLAGLDPKRCWTVTYAGPRRGDSRRSGTMHTGKPPLELEEGMIINVADTSNA
jgi:hypothetical protein